MAAVSRRNHHDKFINFEILFKAVSEMLVIFEFSAVKLTIVDFKKSYLEELGGNLRKRT